VTSLNNEDPEQSPSEFVIIDSTNSEQEAREWEVLLSEAGIVHEIVDSLTTPMAETVKSEVKTARYVMLVPLSIYYQVSSLLQKYDKEVSPQTQPTAALYSTQSLALGVALSLLLTIVFWRAPGLTSDLGSRFAMQSSLVWHGEWFRCVTAVFFHSNVEHLLSNLTFLIALVYFLSAAIGPGQIMLAFVITGAFGNFVSLLLHNKNHISLGASGAVFGLLGLLIGIALRRANFTDARWRRRAIWGSALALVGLTAFSQHVDMAAHLGGFFFGLLLSLLWSPWPSLSRDIFAALLATGIVIGSFSIG